MSHALSPQRTAYVHVARGKASVNGQPLAAGDGATVTGEAAVDFTAGEHAEILLFDLV